MWTRRFIDARNKLNDEQMFEPHDLFTFGILQRIRRTKLFMNFSSLEKRKITFKSCRVKLNQDPEILSKNGFYYIGKWENFNNKLPFICINVVLLLFQVIPVVKMMIV